MFVAMAPLNGVRPERQTTGTPQHHHACPPRLPLPTHTSITTTMPYPPQPFSSLPILPLSHALNPTTKPRFLADLRHALLNVGFLYLSETGLPEQLVKDVIRECRGFFVELPQGEKEKIEMRNEKSFLGWSRVS